MAVTVHLDTVEGSQAELSGQQASRAIRTGMAEGLPLTGANPEDVLWLVTTAAGMPAMGDNYPGRPNLKLSTIRVYGLSVEHARVELLYEPFGGNGGTASILEVSSSVATYETNLMPKTKQAIVVDWIPADPTKFTPITASPVTMTMLRPLARVVVTQLRNGTLDVNTCAAFAANVGAVNNNTWMGYASGAWLVTSASAVVSKYAGTYQTRLEATRQGDDLWSYYGILQSQETGKFAYDPATTPGLITTLRGGAYTPQTVTATAGSGVVRVDPYAAINFSTLFGF